MAAYLYGHVARGSLSVKFLAVASRNVGQFTLCLQPIAELLIDARSAAYSECLLFLQHFKGSTTPVAAPTSLTCSREEVSRSSSHSYTEGHLPLAAQGTCL